MATAVATRGTAPEGRNRLLIIGAVVFGLITAVLLFTALQSGDEGGSEAVRVTTRDVLVVNRDVGPNTVLTADMLELRAVPADQVLSRAYADIDAAVGLPVRFPLQSGEQVTTVKVGLTELQDEDDLALVLPPGKRGFAVQTTEVSAVGGNLLPGNLVDVIAVFDEGTFGGVTRSVTVLQGIEVLAIAQEALEPVPVGASDPDAAADAETTEATGTGIQGQRADGVERQPAARSVTLAVAPQEAQLLATLQSQGDVEIWLALRRPDDPAADEVDSTDLGPFFLPPRESE